MSEMLIVSWIIFTLFGYIIGHIRYTKNKGWGFWFNKRDILRERDD